VVRTVRRNMGGERSVTSDNSHLPNESTVVDQSLGRQEFVAGAGTRQPWPRAVDAAIAAPSPPHASGPAAKGSQQLAVLNQGIRERLGGSAERLLARSAGAE